MRVVAAVPAIGLLAGSVIGMWWADGAATPIVVTLLAALAVAAMAIRRQAGWMVAMCVAIGFAAGGVLLARTAWHERERPTLRLLFESIARAERVASERNGQTLPLDDNPWVVIIGRLRQDAAASPDGGVSLDLATRWIGRARSAGRHRDGATNPVEGGLRLSVAGSLAADQADAWRAGRLVRVFAQIRRPSRYLDPHVPDMERAQRRRGVALVGSVKSAALVEVVRNGTRLEEAAAAARVWARHAMRDAVGRWSPQSAAIVAAIVLGDRTGLDRRVEDQLQRAGTYHVIAISGGNIAILTGLTLTLFRLMGVLGRTAMLSAIVGLLAYAMLVGGGPSVERATWMAVIYLAGRALDLRGSALNVLAVAAGLLVVANPLAVEEPAFLLTFGATLAIVATGSAVPKGRRPKAVTVVVSTLVASAAAEAMLLPIAATFFSRVTFAGLILNFAAIPLMAVAQLAGLALLPIALVSSPVASLVGRLAHLGADGLVRSSGFVDLLPALTWRVAPPALWVSTVYAVSLVVSWLLWRHTWGPASPRRRTWRPASAGRQCVRAARFCATGIAALAMAWILFEPWRVLANGGDGRLHVTFIDVGQGDAAFIRFPHGTTWLVDAGGLANGAFDIGDRVVAPTLRAAGVKRLDTLIVTHGDADHAGGAAAIVREFRPREVWEGVPVPPLVPMQELRAVAASVRARWTTVQSRDRMVVDDVSVEVRHPDPPDWERQDVRNDDSVVVELLWRDVSIVLTGDIGREPEQALAGRFAPAPLRVVKVPHHGSLTSSSDAFVRALAPEVAIVTVGRGNRFGHPAPAVLKRYDAAGVDVFRTDRDGTIALTTDGAMLDVAAYTGRRHVWRRPDAVSPRVISPVASVPRARRAGDPAWFVPMPRLPTPGS